MKEKKENSYNISNPQDVTYIVMEKLSKECIYAHYEQKNLKIFNWDTLQILQNFNYLNIMHF